MSQCVCVWDDCDLCVPCADYSDDLWRLSLETLEWTRIEVATGSARPSARNGHTMTIVGMDLWVHGGETYSGASLYLDIDTELQNQAQV